jgi:O-antigen/teichoic acid export membrane protein
MKVQTTNRVRYIWRVVRQSSEASKFATDVLMYGISQVFAETRGLILLPLISIGLSLADYGIWTQTSATAVLLLPLLILGLNQAAVRYLPGMRDDKERFAEAFFGMLLVIYLFCTLVCLAAWPGRYLLSRLILGGDTYVRFIYLLFMLVVGQVSFRFLLNYWRLVLRISHYALIRIVMDAVLLVGLVVIIVWLKLGIMAGILYWVGLQWVFSLALLLFILRQIPFRWPRDFRLVLPYMRYAFPLVLYTAVYWVINSSDRYFIVNYFDLAQVGIYSAAYTLGRIATAAEMPLNFVLLPTLSKMWSQGDKNNVRNYTERSIDFYFITAVPLVVLLGANARFFLDLLAGVTIPEGRLVMSLVCVAFLFTGLDQFFRNILMLQERTVRLLVTIVPIALLNLVLNYCLIPLYGIVGAAIATVVSMALKAVALYVQSQRDFRYQLNVWLVLRILLSSISIILVVWLIPVDTIWLLVVDTGLGGLLYLAGLVILKVISVQEVYAYLQRVRGQLVQAST